MTEEQILRIARESGFLIIDSPVWQGAVRVFIERLIVEIAKEQNNDQ